MTKRRVSLPQMGLQDQSLMMQQSEIRQPKLQSGVKGPVCVYVCVTYFMFAQHNENSVPAALSCFRRYCRDMSLRPLQNKILAGCVLRRRRPVAQHVL